MLNELTLKNSWVRKVFPNYHTTISCFNTSFSFNINFKFMTVNHIIELFVPVVKEFLPTKP